MKTHKPCAWVACLGLLCSVLSTSAEQTAVVKQSNVNVRGQPSLAGEVITQLQQGEKVVVLEEVPATKPKTNEPARWARIQMPAKTPVWVYGPFVDTSSKSVKVPRLNLRAGPGENFSVVGRLARGTTINEIRRVEDWIEIDTPAGAYAFVAADLLTTGEEVVTLAPNSTPPSTPKTDPAVLLPAPAAPGHSNPLAESIPPIQLPGKLEPTPSVASTSAPNAFTPAPAGEIGRLEPSPSATIGAAAPAVLAPSGSAAPATSTAARSDETERRIVRREGLVRSTVSIQAPTYYELLSPENRKTINYLHTDRLNLNLKDYRGRRIVVTGEEAIDPRWPKTPVIEVETLELIP
jgi:hypothetical protein